MEGKELEKFIKFYKKQDVFKKTPKELKPILLAKVIREAMKVNIKECKEVNQSK